jgi:glycosyltransferase involved in cell wall biosynthesis
MNYLISDLNIKLDGHKLGFVQNLIEYLSKTNTDNKYYILVNKSDQFKLIEPSKQNIFINYTTEIQQTEIASKKRFLARAAKEWQVLVSFCSTNNIDKLVLLELDPYQVEIGKSYTNFTIFGIWFRPYHRLQPETSGVKAALQNQRFILQKKLTMWFALRNKKLKKVFILNDESLTNLKQPKSNPFVCLPDPIFEYPQLDNFDLRKHYSIPSGNLILLQFGFIDERKNTENIIKALNLIEEKEALKITLLIIGKFRKGYEEKLKNLKTGSLQLLTHNEFISNQQMEATFAQADLILRMNVGFYGSSGIVGIAANHNKPCIVSNSGVMAEQVKKYKLGEVVDAFDIYKIKETILKYKNDKNLLKINGLLYKNSHTIEVFAKTLLELN